VRCLVSTSIIILLWTIITFGALFLSNLIGLLFVQSDNYGFLIELSAELRPLLHRIDETLKLGTYLPNLLGFRTHGICPVSTVAESIGSLFHDLLYFAVKTGYTLLHFFLPRSNITATEMNWRTLKRNGHVIKFFLYPAQVSFTSIEYIDTYNIRLMRFIKDILCLVLIWMILRRL